MKRKKKTTCINISGTIHNEPLIVKDGGVEEGTGWLKIRNRKRYSYTLRNLWNFVPRIYLIYV